MNTIVKFLVKIVPIFLFFLLVVASNCKKSNDDCHRYLEIVNNSTFPVIYSTKLYNGLSIDSCLLTKNAVLESGESYKEFNRSCWNKSLELTVFDIYIVDMNGRDSTGFHECDSIYFYNDILRHYRLDETNIDSLKSVDWIIRYP